jgi:plasmid rolling circle replication initiator protein Rep
MNNKYICNASLEQKKSVLLLEAYTNFIKRNDKPTKIYIPLMSTKIDKNSELLLEKQLNIVKSVSEIPDKDKLNYQKRARAKAFTNSYLFDLIDLKSPLVKSYWNTYHCSRTILQEDRKFTAKYCNNRWCLTCNRIRTAKMINGYSSSIEQFDNPQFVTLTIPNVKAKDLRIAIEEMNVALMHIRRNLKKTYKINLKALRKYESTYNLRTNTFHPHFHLIVEGKDTSDLLVDLWLKQFTKADRKAQDVRLASETSLTELCKYFTKIIAKDNDYNPRALDIMFRAVKGKRTFQPIGIRKDVSEDVDEIQSQEVDFKPPSNEIWVYETDVYDWVTHDGELLCEYSPSDKDLNVIQQKYKPPPK